MICYKFWQKPAYPQFVSSFVGSRLTCRAGDTLLFVLLQEPTGETRLILFTLQRVPENRQRYTDLASAN